MSRRKALILVGTLGATVLLLSDATVPASALARDSQSFNYQQPLKSHRSAVF